MTSIRKAVCFFLLFLIVFSAAGCDAVDDIDDLFDGEYKEYSLWDCSFKVPEEWEQNYKYSDDSCLTFEPSDNSSFAASCYQPDGETCSEYIKYYYDGSAYENLNNYRLLLIEKITLDDDTPGYIIEYTYTEDTGQTFHKKELSFEKNDMIYSFILFTDYDEVDDLNKYDEKYQKIIDSISF